MKLNLNNVFDDLDLNNTQSIAKENISVEYNSEVTDNIKSNVFEKLDLKISDKKSKKNVFKLSRLIIIASVIIILAGSISVGAAVSFKPDSAVSQFFEMNEDVDMNTLGQDVNLTSSSKGLDFTMKQVLTDNSILNAELECPSYKGKVLIPAIGNVRIFVNGKENDEVTVYTGNSEEDSNNLMLSFSGLKNIRNNSEIKIIFDSVMYTDDVENFEDDRFEILGDWSFEFKNRRSDVKKKIDVDEIIISKTEKYKIKNFVVSPLGLSYDFVVAECTEEEYNKSNVQGSVIPVVIEMKDGTVYSNNEMSSSSDLETDLKTNKSAGNYMVIFETIINVDNIKSITIRGNIVYQA